MGDHFKSDTDDSGLFKIPEEDTSPSYFIPEKIYQILKWIALIFLPALAVFIGTVGPQWGMSNVESIVITINAIGLFIGTCIGLSQITSK